MGLLMHMSVKVEYSCPWCDMHATEGSTDQKQVHGIMQHDGTISEVLSHNMVQPIEVVDTM